MFGLGKDNKGNEFVFDFEADVKDPSNGRKIKEDIAQKIREVKNILRSGQNKEEFDSFGILLHGYTSLQKVMARVGKSFK